MRHLRGEGDSGRWDRVWDGGTSEPDSPIQIPESELPVWNAALEAELAWHEAKLVETVREETRRVMDEHHAAHDWLSRIERDGEVIPDDLQTAKDRYAAALEGIRLHDEFCQWAARWMYQRAMKRAQLMSWWEQPLFGELPPGGACEQAGTSATDDEQLHSDGSRSGEAHD